MCRVGLDSIPILWLDYSTLGQPLVSTLGSILANRILPINVSHFLGLVSHIEFASNTTLCFFDFKVQLLLPVESIDFRFVCFLRSLSLHAVCCGHATLALGLAPTASFESKLGVGLICNP
jgi:hypothetical protein